MHGSDDAIVVLVKQGASLLHYDLQGFTALHLAACAGHSGTVAKLLLMKAPVDATNYAGQTPLLCAARCEYYNVIINIFYVS